MAITRYISRPSLFSTPLLTVTLPKTKKAKAQGRKIPVSNGK
jgi:hypothetical protein